MPWNKPLQLFLVMVVGINLLPLLGLVPVWVSSVTALLLGLKLVHLLRAVPLPKPIYILLSSIAMIVLIGFNRKTLLGQDAGTDLLVLFASYKLLETHRYRDVMINVMICFFLLMVNLLNNQGLGTMAFLAVDLVLITQILLQLHPGNTSLVSLKAVLKLLMITMPIWAILFFVFPRFTVGFMQSPRTLMKAGFSGTLNPGDLAQIVRSNEISFRVRFGTERPRMDDLYWRGAVLSQAEGSGLKWDKAPIQDYPPEFFVPDPNRPESTGSIYEVFLEPIYNQWLFKLDYPGPHQQGKISNNSIIRRPGLIYEFQREVVSRIAYTGEHAYAYPRQRLTVAEQKFYSKLPPNLEPEVMALAQNLKLKVEGEGQALASVEHLFAWYQLQKFRYTLEPGAVPGRALKNFLFGTKLGFCEHYAAATATLLRAMGFPARVVVGFQGAERNDLGDYYIVKSTNAHAWDEVWVSEGQGLGRWTRVDPVSVIAPVRLAMGSDFFSLPAGAQNGNDAGTLALRSSALAKLANKLRLTWDAAEMQWGSFLLAYDFEFQQAWLKKLGVQNNSRVSFFLALLVSITLLIAGIARFLRREARVKDPVLDVWKVFVKKLEKKGIFKAPGEGPSDYLLRAQQALPAFQGPIDSIGNLYLAMRYQSGPGDLAAQLKLLRAQIKAFR